MNPSGNDYHLSPTSPAIDKGLTLASVTTDPSGAYEASFATAHVRARNKSQPDLQARVTVNGKRVSLTGDELVLRDLPAEVLYEGAGKVSR